MWKVEIQTHQALGRNSSCDIRLGTNRCTKDHRRRERQEIRRYWGNHIVLVQGLKEGLNGKERELRDLMKLGAGKMEQ